MKRIFIYTISGILLLVSCKKNEPQKQYDEKETAVKIEENLKVSVEVIIHEDDNFHLYYTEDGTIEFDEERSIWASVSGSKNVQEITFTLPENVYPTNLRIDFGYGKNENQSDVTLQSFKIAYLDNIFEVENTDIFNYFYPNQDNTVVIPNTAILQRKDKSQNTAPIIYPLPQLTEELNKIIE